jgi:hypothetical protein
MMVSASSQGYAAAELAPVVARLREISPAELPPNVGDGRDQGGSGC